FSRVFEQYLRTTKIPELAYEVSDGSVSVWWQNVVSEFQVPVVLRVNGREYRAMVGEKPIKIAVTGKLESFELDRNFYMTVKAK
ncbi:MAG: hypothetical protein ACI9S9_004339, partial [Planctomycetota bacterium]